MATEKFFVFNEDGALKRLKGRIVRFLDNEDPTGSDKSAIRTSLEVSPDAAGLVQADVGTAPNEIPVNGMLGDMAYQSSDGVSAAKLQVESTTGTATTQALTVTDGTDTNFVVQEDGSVGVGTSSPDSTLEVIGASATSNNGATVLVTDSASVAADIGGTIALRGTDGTTDRTLALIKGGKVDGTSAFDGYLSLQTRSNGAANTTERVRIDSAGRVAIGNSSPSSYNADANDLVVGAAGTGNRGLTIASGSANYGVIYFADGTTGNQQYRGAISYNHNTDALSLGTVGATRWYINSSGNLVSNGAYGIDFGSAAAAGRTVESGLLSDYEIGTWSPVYSTSAAAMTTPPTMDIIHARYVKVGGLVHLEAYIRTDSVDTSGGSGNLMITGLPFAPHTGSYSSVQVSLATDWGTDTPLSGYAYPTGITLLKRSSVNGVTSNMSVTDLTNGTTANQNRLIFSAAYYTSA